MQKFVKTNLSDDNTDRKLRYHGVRARPNTKMGNRVVLWGRAITRRRLPYLYDYAQPADHKTRVYHGSLTPHFTVSCLLTTPFVNR